MPKWPAGCVSSGPLPEIYTNEDDNIDAWDVVPKGLSMLSYDDYDNHNNNGSVELSRQWGTPTT